MSQLASVGRIVHGSATERLAANTQVGVAPPSSPR